MGYLLHKFLGLDSRHKNRTPICVLVEEPGKHQDYFNKTYDISENGMFIETDCPRRIGEELTLKFALPGRPPITLKGAVTRIQENHKPKRLGPTAPEGMAVQFTGIDAKSGRILREFISP